MKVMIGVRVFAVFAVLIGTTAQADIIVSIPNPRVSAGAPVTLDLTITNGDSDPVVIELPAQVHVRLETANTLTTLGFAAERSGRIEVGPGQFARIRLNGTLPSQAQGAATVVPTGLSTNSLALQIDAAAPAPQGPQQAAAGTALIDKPPLLPVSVYEPVYFLVGGDGGLNAKFQISLRYQLFDGRGPLARRLPWIDDLYLSFSQTSLWDLGDLSKPFKDSSYRPRLFYTNYDLARFFDGQLRVGVEAGAGHESNGKEGEESRSFNMLYVRPALTFGEPDGFRMYVAPLIHNYVADDENPDLEDYRGYVDWLVGIGSKGGLDFWATLRKGARSDYGSIELNASYPLSKLSGGDLTGWLTLQYFTGYGESLLDYSRKLDSQLRLGVSVAL